MKRDEIKKILEYITKYGTYKIDHNKEINKLHNSILEIYNSQSINNGVESNIEKILEIEPTKYGIFKTISTDKTRGKNDARKMLLESTDKRFFALLTDFEYRLKKQVQTVIEIKRKYNDIDYCDLLDTLEGAISEGEVAEMLKIIETYGVKPREIKKREVFDSSNIESFIIDRNNKDTSFTKKLPANKEMVTNQIIESKENEYPVFNIGTSCTKNIIPIVNNDILEFQEPIFVENRNITFKIKSPIKKPIDVCLLPKAGYIECSPSTLPNNTDSRSINAEMNPDDEKLSSQFNNQLSPPEAVSSQNYEDSEELNFVIGSIIEQSVKRDNMNDASLDEKNIDKHKDTEETIAKDFEINNVNSDNNHYNIDLMKVNKVDLSKFNEATPPKTNNLTSQKATSGSINPVKRTKTSLDSINSKSDAQLFNKYNPYILNSEELKGINIVEVPSKEIEAKMKFQNSNRSTANFEFSFEPPEIKENRVTDLVKDQYKSTVSINKLCTDENIDQNTNDQENSNKRVLQNIVSKTEIVKKNRIKERLTVSIPKIEQKIVNNKEADPASTIDYSEILKKSRQKK